MAWAFYAVDQLHRPGIGLSAEIALISLVRGYSLDQAELASLLRGILWLAIIVFDVVIAILLAKSASITRPVTRAREMLVPLASTFMLLFYNFIPWMPKPTTCAVLAGMQVCLLVARARMEERSLADVYPEYSEYARRTGFFWPRFPLGPR